MKPKADPSSASGHRHQAPERDSNILTSLSFSGKQHESQLTKTYLFMEQDEKSRVISVENSMNGN